MYVLEDIILLPLRYPAPTVYERKMAARAPIVVSEIT